MKISLIKLMCIIVTLKLRYVKLAKSEIIIVTLLWIIVPLQYTAFDNIYSA